ncbi:MAG TPA: secretin N-terminal domain-containing protein, partial [Nannocystaceae bacterium]|nr:secretin N-terminal domain-containing protein [Nannocystaceae bacterium]
RERDLGAAQALVDAARLKLAALGETVSVAELERAKSETRKVQATATVLDKQVARLRGESDAAKARAEAAERKLHDLEAAGARRKKVEAARVEAERAQADATAAKGELASSKKRLAAVESDLVTRQAELARLSERRTVLEREGKDLAEKNAAAKAELAKAEGKLADVERVLGGEKDRLRAIEDEVRKAQTRLDDHLGEIAARSAAPAAPPKSAAPEPKYATSTESRPAAKAPPAAKKGKPTKVRDVRFEDDRDESRVVIVYDGVLDYAGNSLTPTIQVLELEHVKMATSLERSLDATAYKGPIKLVTSFAEDGDAKVVVSTSQATKPRLEEKPGELVWHFPRKSGKGKPTDAVSMAGTKVASSKTTAPAASLALPRTTTAAMMAPPSPATTDDDLDFDTRPTRRSTRGKWRGERITIELQDAPMKDVLLLFSDIGNVNIISGRNVEGSVSMKLTNVPWDQALDIILRSQGLGYSVDGNVYRVATLEDLESERKAAIERANARVQLKPLESKLVPVSYATVDEMVPKVQSVLSPRGSVTPDTRTNQLIIMDVAENLALAEALVQSLDTQTPQVLIEARIVEARTTFTRNLGVQWGFDYIASPGTGNPTGLLFPNSIGVGGGATGRPADTRGLILPAAQANPNYAVDLPIPVGTGTGGAIGFSFGSISGNLNTNLRLSASESTGEIRIISAPKIVTLDNNEAQIEQGVQIPISQVSAQGVNTRFVRATLSLQVTP